MEWLALVALNPNQQERHFSQIQEGCRENISPMGYSRHALDVSSLQLLLETASTVFTML